MNILQTTTRALLSSYQPLNLTTHHKPSIFTTENKEYLMKTPELNCSRTKSPAVRIGSEESAFTRLRTTSDFHDNDA